MCTAFFKTDTKFYRRVLKGVGFDVNRTKGISLEYAYYNRLRLELFDSSERVSIIPRMPQWNVFTFHFEKFMALLGFAGF